MGNTKRTAFTMVELVVVIGIILVLAALTIMIFPKIQSSSRVARGADTVQGQLFLAKQTALRDQAPRGVRLVVDPADNQVHSLQLIEQPRPYGFQATTVVQTAPGVSPAGWDVFLTGNFLAGTIQVGDLVWLGDDMYSDPTPYEQSTGRAGPHALHYVNFVPPGTTNTFRVLSQPLLRLTHPIPVPGRVDRAPRPMIGVSPVALPTDVVVDCPLALGHPTLGTSLGLHGAGNQDILFDPSGKVLGSVGGKVVLWVYDPTNGTPEQALVAVYSRTGNIVAQPVNIAGPDPYAFVKDGTTGGM